MVEGAEKNGFKKRVIELEEFLHGFTFELTKYDEQLVMLYIQRVTVYSSHFEIEYKAGFKLNIGR